MKKGYTLVELLVIIVVMGLLATLLVPAVTGIVDRTTNKVFKEDARAIIRASEEIINDYAEGECFNVKDDNLEINLSSDIRSGEVCVINHRPFLKHIKNSNMCISGSDNDLEVYNCNEKVVVFFDGTSLGMKNIPVKDVSVKAFIIDKNTTLDLDKYNYKYIDLDSNTEINTINFYDDLNLQYAPKKWVNASSLDEFTSSTVVTSDTKLTINEYIKIEDINTSNTLETGTYKIKMSTDNSKSIGFKNLSIANANNRVIIKDNSLWYVHDYNNEYFVFFVNNNKELVWDVPGGIVSNDLEVNLYYITNFDQQKFNIIPTGTKNHYMIQSYQDSTYCVQAQDLVEDSKLIYKPCDASNPNQIFKFIKRN